MVQERGIPAIGRLAIAAALTAAAGSHAQLPNDDRAGAIRIVPGQAVTAETTMATASADPLPSTSGCAFLGWSAPRKDIWYRFDPPQPDGFLTLDLCASTFDTSVVLYRLDPASGTIGQIACDDDDCNPTGPTYQSRIADLRLAADPRPVLIRVAGWSDQVGTLRMRAAWVPAATLPVRFTAGGFSHDGVVQVGSDRSVTQGPGTRGPVHAFVQGRAEAGGARANGQLAAEVRSGWSGSDAEVRLTGSIEAVQPRNAGASSWFRCGDGSATGGEPLELTLDADRYFRITSSGSVQPTIVAGTGCVCGDRLTAGTYFVAVDASVSLAGSQPSAQASVAWSLELRSSRFRPGDLDGNGIVNGDDLGRLLTAWGGTEADIDGDGVVDGDDLGILLVDWGA